MCVCERDYHLGISRIIAYCATIYVMVYQPSLDSQALLASNSRISKGNLTILTFELVSTNMVGNSVSNISLPLKKTKRKVSDRLE